MKFDYTDLINKGFKREDSNDSIFFNQYGYQYFMLTKTLNPYTYFDWDLTNQKLYVVMHTEEHNVTFKKLIETENDYNLIETIATNPNEKSIDRFGRP